MKYNDLKRKVMYTNEERISNFNITVVWCVLVTLIY